MPVGDPFYKDVLANFKKGLSYEANNNYKAVNDTIADKKKQALGKYQFVPESHWSEIQKFASKMKIPMNTYQDFLDQPIVQEEFFENYFQKKVFPFVEKNKNKMRNMSADELAYYYHHEGPGGAQNYIQTGKLREKTKINPSGEVFMKGYKNHRESNNGKPVYGFTQGYVDKNYESFKRDINEINRNPNKLSEDLLNEKRIETQLKYQKQGLLPYFNRIIQDKNKTTELKGADRKEVLNTINGILENEDYLTSDIVNAGKKSGKVQMLIDKEDVKNVWNKPEFAQYRKYFSKSGKDKYKIDVPLKNDKNNILNTFENDVRSVPGNENYRIYNDKGEIMEAMAWYNRPVDFDGVSVDVNDKGRIIHNNWNENTKISIPDYNNPKVIKTSFNIPLLAEIPIIEPETTNTEKTPTETAPEAVNPNQPTQTEMDKYIAYDKEKTAAAQKLADDGILKDYFNSERDETQVADPNAKKKDTFPYADILSQAAGTVIGLSMANTKINYRDEQVNDDFRNYTAELSKLSKIGLRPEEEAYAKKMLTEAYQGSVDRITSASNGNRNSVLGNLGRVDGQRNQGLMELALADAQAKNEALHKYGEATKYINEFDARRDIANNERKYNNILQTKQAGSEIAGSAMSAFIDSIHNYQDNKPGSWNDSYKSHMSKRLFGVDITLKDDGTGNIPYTPSWKAKNDQALLSKNKEFNQYRTMFSELKPEDQKVINDKFRESGGDIKSTYKMIDAAKNGTIQNQSAYTNMFKADPSIPTSTEPTAVLKDISTEPTQPNTEPTSSFPKDITLQSLLKDSSGQESDRAKQIEMETEALKNEGNKTLNLLSETKNMFADTLAKVEEGRIGSDKKNEIIDQLYKNAEKRF